MDINMNLWTQVHLTDNGPVRDDDGETAWFSTLLSFGRGEKTIAADVHVDAYSGKAVGRITRDDFGFHPDLIGRLVVRLYWVCGSHMRQFNCDHHEAVCDLESIIRDLFYRSSAERLLRKFRTAIVASKKNTCLPDLSIITVN
jgi:hypothetical protein